jgi:hypothetical protein
MNKIAMSLNVVGFACIAGGFIIGFSTYQTPLEGFTLLKEENYGILFAWIGSGLVSGIMMFGFAEVVNILHDIRNKIKGEKNTTISHENKKKNKFTEFVEETVQNKSRN